MACCCGNTTCTCVKRCTCSVADCFCVNCCTARHSEDELVSGSQNHSESNDIRVTEKGNIKSSVENLVCSESETQTSKAEKKTAYNKLHNSSQNSESEKKFLSSEITNSSSTRAESQNNQNEFLNLSSDFNASFASECQTTESDRVDSSNILSVIPLEETALFIKQTNIENEHAKYSLRTTDSSESKSQGAAANPPNSRHKQFLKHSSVQDNSYSSHQHFARSNWRSPRQARKQTSDISNDRVKGAYSTTFKTRTNVSPPRYVASRNVSQLDSSRSTVKRLEHYGNKPGKSSHRTERNITTHRHGVTVRRNFQRRFVYNSSSPTFCVPRISIPPRTMSRRFFPPPPPLTVAPPVYYCSYTLSTTATHAPVLIVNPPIYTRAQLQVATSNFYTIHTPYITENPPLYTNAFTQLSNTTNITHAPLLTVYPSSYSTPLTQLSGTTSNFDVTQAQLLIIIPYSYTAPLTLVTPTHTQLPVTTSNFDIGFHAYDATPQFDPRHLYTSTTVLYDSSRKSVCPDLRWNVNPFVHCNLPMHPSNTTANFAPIPSRVRTPPYDRVRPGFGPPFVPVVEFFDERSGLRLFQPSVPKALLSPLNVRPFISAWLDTMYEENARIYTTISHLVVNPQISSSEQCQIYNIRSRDDLLATGEDIDFVLESVREMCLSESTDIDLEGVLADDKISEELSSDDSLSNNHPYDTPVDEFQPTTLHPRMDKITEEPSSNDSLSNNHPHDTPVDEFQPTTLHPRMDKITEEPSSDDSLSNNHPHDTPVDEFQPTTLHPRMDKITDESSSNGSLSNNHPHDTPVHEFQPTTLHPCIDKIAEEPDADDNLSNAVNLNDTTEDEIQTVMEIPSANKITDKCSTDHASSNYRLHDTAGGENQPATEHPSANTVIEDCSTEDNLSINTTEDDIRTTTEYLLVSVDTPSL